MTRKYRTLLIIVVGIGILAAVLIPDLRDALQQARQRRASEEIRTFGAAWFSWLADQIGAATGGSNTYF